MKKKYRFENVDVEFEQERWRVFIKIYRDGKTVKKLVADAGIESGDRIWFGTYEEWCKEAVEELRDEAEKVPIPGVVGEIKGESPRPQGGDEE